MAPRKRTTEELLDLRPPRLDSRQREHLVEGIARFNAGRYWDAHEAWEEVWKQMGDEPGDDAEIIVRGLIQLAAALHLRSIDRRDGMMSNFAKARAKLALAPPQFLGIEFPPLVDAIDTALAGDGSGSFAIPMHSTESD